MFAKNGNLLVQHPVDKSTRWTLQAHLGCPRFSGRAGVRSSSHTWAPLPLLFPHAIFIQAALGQLCGTMFSICRISPDFQYQSFYRYEILQKYIGIMISYIIISESNMMRHRHGSRLSLPHSSNDSETDCPFLPTPLLGGKQESPFTKGNTVKCGLKPLLDMS